MNYHGAVDLIEGRHALSAGAGGLSRRDTIRHVPYSEVNTNNGNSSLKYTEFTH